MKKQFLLLILLIGFMAFACDDDAQLKRSVFIEDPDHKGLPKYSELGYNTFGAYYDRKAFTSSEIVPVKVTVTGGETSFSLHGGIDYGGGYYNYYSDDNDMSITLVMSDFVPGTYTDLTELDDVHLDLTNENYSVIIKTESTTEEVQILNGSFHFKKVKNVLVDQVQKQVVLSGTFEFQALRDGEPITVSTGRFDVGVGADNFYNF
jgi:hypothetical protein